jgi:hypothetical protein
MTANELESTLQRALNDVRSPDAMYTTLYVYDCLRSHDSRGHPVVSTISPTDYYFEYRFCDNLIAKITRTGCEPFGQYAYYVNADGTVDRNFFVTL